MSSKETFIQGDFPFEEIRNENGDYFTSFSDAKAAGFDDDQIWSVCIHDGTYCYGPPHHYVNFFGCVVTREKHDNQTYYEEVNDD